MGDRNKRLCHSAVSSFMHLPVELQTGIFLRLPATCLLICKCVCKTFYSVIQNPDFNNIYITCNRSIADSDTSHALILQFSHKTSSKNNSTSHVLVSIDNITKDVISYTPLTPHIPYAGRLFLVGSSNGLICFAVQAGDWLAEDKILLLWNPVTKQKRYIPVPDVEGFDHHCTMEFYSVPETNDYTVLSIGYSTTDPDGIQVAIYKMSTKSWTVVNGIRFYCQFDVYSGPEFRKPGTSVFLNGSFHWIISSHSADCSHIVAFNLKTEKLSLTKTIDHDNNVPLSFHLCSIGIIEESLAALYWSDHRQDVQIWVMKDYLVPDSWVLKFRLGTSNFWPRGI